MGKFEISVYFCNFEMFILSAFELQPTLQVTRQLIF